ncbi:S-adenosyl-L-methionine-dependent methyltransferase [Lasiosphaeria miniovina]|uniref:S-adenosyl-L-methionine-dependent methyltransferase n=1 Tax=Lasiosphaeria miniovina TaxID=1954250 RepID=A0AA40E801_9PEZI|nr:S-adenosyl-L-methionine-dependent methyltransferase [Lasiosphaeria miniovina]KAK0728467.1 S-adenosyl-L-methionine-dependent methyltransferase [Lasiosphaeria miniovina]
MAPSPPADTTAATGSSTAPAPEPLSGSNRLRDTFAGQPLSAHPTAWDALWQASYTPWDRGGASDALREVLVTHPPLFPPPGGESQTGTKRRRRAPVPGCGRGYDAVLLSRAFGYDVVGLDSSAEAVRAAVANAAAAASGAAGNGDVYAPQTETETSTGSVEFVLGDFFDEDGVLGKPADDGDDSKFDLIFDYTFFCALPIEARPRWARRMADLLRRDTGRLVCLEWPLHKPPATGGPPWGVTARAYAAHLDHPGVELAYQDDNSGDPIVSPGSSSPSNNGALRCLARFQPQKTHKAGCDEHGNVIDYVSVWGHQ